MVASTIEPIKAWYVAENDLKTSRTGLDIREGETLTLDDPRSELEARLLAATEKTRCH